MDTTIASPTAPHPTPRSAMAPAARPSIVTLRAEPMAPTCECPEYCLLDHSN